MTFTIKTGPPYDTPVVTRPKGGTRVSDTATTNTGGFTEIAAHTPAEDVAFSLAKIIVTWHGTDEQQIRIKLDTETIAEYYATDCVLDWFPPETSLVGDGIKKIAIEAQATAIGAPITGFIIGEET